MELDYNVNVILVLLSVVSLVVLLKNQNFQMNHQVATFKSRWVEQQLVRPDQSPTRVNTKTQRMGDPTTSISVTGWFFNDCKGMSDSG